MKVYKDKYIYPAIFDYADDGISVEFPDLPGCLTFGDSEEEAFMAAFLSLFMVIALVAYAVITVIYL